MRNDALGRFEQIVEVPPSTLNQEEAADTIGCEVTQIVNIFCICETGRTFAHFNIECQMGRWTANCLLQKIEKVDADFRGIPSAIYSQCKVLIDQDLLKHEVCGAVGGTIDAVFSNHQISDEEVIEVS